MKTRAVIQEECFNLFYDLLESKDADLVTSFSISPYAIIFLVNELLINKRKYIFEFGSGLSTIILAQAIKKVRLDTKIVSVENDSYWLDKIIDRVKSYGLENIVKFIYAPVFPCPSLGKRNKWYDQSILKAEIDPDEKFDMVVVDGPPAYNEFIELSRYQALPFLYNSLAENHIIFLDDATRPGERKVLNMWEDQFDVKFTIYGQRIAASHKGKVKDSSPEKCKCVSKLLKKSGSID